MATGRRSRELLEKVHANFFGGCILGFWVGLWVSKNMQERVRASSSFFQGVEALRTGALICHSAPFVNSGGAGVSKGGVSFGRVCPVPNCPCCPFLRFSQSWGDSSPIFSGVLPTCPFLFLDL